MEDLTLITCSYNTPEITLTMLRSWVSVHKSYQNIVLCDNSTNDETKNLLLENEVPFISNYGMSHGNGVNKALDLCNTKYALLVDTDVIFLKDHSEIFNRFKNMDLTIMGKIEGDRGGKSIYNRVNPWHCFINVDKIKQYNITFFNEKKMRDSFKCSKIYDIGSTFFEDIKTNKLKIGDIDLGDKYYIHLEGMSWYKNKFDKSKEDTGIDFGGTHNNPGYVKSFESKYQMFKAIEDKFKHINIKNRFIYE